MDASEFYCKACKVQMNSQHMWDSHINGKRHIKKVNKDAEDEHDFDTPKEEEAPAVEDAGFYEQQIAKIDETLKGVSEAIVGLDYVIELQYPDTDIHPSYSCTLCKCTIGVMAVVDHITSTKHRMNYVEQKDQDGFQILENMQSSGVPLDGLAEVRASTLEQKYGRGTVKVKMEKSKFGSISGMRKRPQSNVNENMMQNRTSAPYSSFHGMELNAAERQFLAQIPYFEINTKLQMLEQLSSIDLSDDNEAKDAMNMITCLTTLLRRFKSALHANENPRMNVPNRNQGMSMVQREREMLPRDPAMLLSQRDQGMCMPQRDLTMGGPRGPPGNFGPGMKPSGDWNEMGMDGGNEFRMPTRDIRQAFNEPIGYPQPIASRPPFGGPAGFRNPHAARTSFM